MCICTLQWYFVTNAKKDDSEHGVHDLFIYIWFCCPSRTCLYLTPPFLYLYSQQCAVINTHWRKPTTCNEKITFIIHDMFLNFLWGFDDLKWSEILAYMKCIANYTLFSVVLYSWLMNLRTKHFTAIWDFRMAFSLKVNFFFEDLTKNMINLLWHDIWIKHGYQLPNRSKFHHYGFL